MQPIEKILHEIGLTNTEIQIYLCGSTRSLTAHEIAKAANLKRTTVYHALETLTAKGFVIKQNNGSRQLFVMISPSHIERMLDRQIASLAQQKEILSSLTLPSSRHNVAQPDTVRVFHFEGVAGIKVAIDEALFCRSRKWDIIAPSKNFFSEFEKKYATYYLETRKRRGIKTRTLWEKDPQRKRKLTPAEIIERSPRYLPASMKGAFSSIIIIFDEKVLIISTLKEQSAIIIESVEVARTMKAVFDCIWSISESYS